MLILLNAPNFNVTHRNVTGHYLTVIFSPKGTSLTKLPDGYSKHNVTRKYRVETARAELNHSVTFISKKKKLSAWRIKILEINYCDSLKKYISRVPIWYKQ